LPCGNTAKEGEIETNLLTGKLGYLDKSSKEVGVDIKPQSGKEFAKFNCANVISIVVGEATSKEGPAYPPKGGGDGVIGVVSPVNEMVTGFNEAFTTDEETAENTPSKFEGGSPQVLEDYFNNLTIPGDGSKWSPAGETVTVDNKCNGCNNGEGVAELKA
jgi:hypothetical protein